jgi:dTMP kinase
MDGIYALSEWASDGVSPDLTIIIDIDPNEGLRRKNDQKETNRMEELDVTFHQKVREGFQEIARRDERRVRLINGHQPQDYLLADVWSVIYTGWLNHITPHED